MARPTKLTPEVQKNILQVLRTTTSTLESAALKAGVSPPTLYRWLAKGKEQKRGAFREFREACTKARAERLITFEGKVAKAGDKDWRALAWLLERTEPKRYAQRVRVHVEEELTDALRKIKERLKPEVYEEVLAALVEGDRGEGAEPDSFLEDGPDDLAGGEAVQPAPAKPEAEAVPRPRG